MIARQDTFMLIADDARRAMRLRCCLRLLPLISMFALKDAPLSRDAPTVIAIIDAAAHVNN